MTHPRQETYNQTYYILVRKQFQSGVNVHRTRSFPGAHIGSDSDSMMMTFQVCLKNTKKPTQSRLRFDPEKLKNPDVAGTFRATTCGKFAPLINLRADDTDVDSTDIDSMITINNTAATDTASEILGKKWRRKKPWVTRDVL